MYAYMLSSERLTIILVYLHIIIAACAIANELALNFMFRYNYFELKYPMFFAVLTVPSFKCVKLAAIYAHTPYKMPNYTAS
jgi:hypothetical protein